MGKIRFLLAVAALVLLARTPPCMAHEMADKAPPDAMKLTADDYAAIQQLAVRYAWVLDHCVNGGYDYADLYVDDGQFSVAEDWGTTSNNQRSSVAKGRDALAQAAGGGENGKCVNPREYVGFGVSHIVVNHLITPTRTGAVGKHRLIAVGVCGYPHLMELQGDTRMCTSRPGTAGDSSPGFMSSDRRRRCSSASARTKKNPIRIRRAGRSATPLAQPSKKLRIGR